jgi:hypothetical protein
MSNSILLKFKIKFFQFAAQLINDVQYFASRLYLSWIDIKIPIIMNNSFESHTRRKYKRNL